MFRPGNLGHLGRLGLVAASRNAFSPLSLFAAGEQGAWYDQSDLSTLFQDPAGTTPVTAAGQPVGLMLDKRLGLALGSELASSSLITSVAIGGPAFTNYTIAPSTAVGNTYRISFRVTNYSGSGSVGVTGNPGADWVVTPPVISGNGLITTTLTSLTANPIRLYSRSSNQCVFSDISVRELPGNHATQSTANSRPILQQETSGQWYLACDGTDDWLVTGSINFSGTNKITLFSGLRKLVDSSNAVFAELGVTLPVGSIALLTSSGGAPIEFESRGSRTDQFSTATTSAFPAPFSSVLACISDIQNDKCEIRVNGSLSAQSTVDQGTGNYSNLPLYLFRRGGTSLPFNGRFYGLILRGAASTSEQITNAERWLAAKTGVTF